VLLGADRQPRQSSHRRMREAGGWSQGWVVVCVCPANPEAPKRRCDGAMQVMDLPVLVQWVHLRFMLRLQYACFLAASH
jgi:hypothetical protein